MSLLDRSLRGNMASPLLSAGTVSAGTLAYTNDRIPAAFNGNVENVLNYLTAALYPNYKGTVANPGALPGGAAINDFYFVTDDGDGNSAGYVWTEVDGVNSWFKRYDVDWTYEGLLGETVNRTQYMYVHKYGLTDKDSSGSAIVGTYAGQKIYGGDLTGQNLTLNANSADTTGYVQTDNHFRPTADNTLDLGTATENFRTAYLGTSLLVDTLTFSAGSITDSGGAISFGNENLTTTGNVTASIGYYTSSIEVGPLVGNALILAPGSITDESGAISFGNENLTTTGTITAASGSVLADMTFTTGSIVAAGGAISFDNENLSTTGTLSAGNTTVTRLDSDNVRIDGNTISILDVNGNLILVANGAGVVDVQSAMTTIGQTVTGTMSVTGQLNADNLRLDGNTISSTDVNGNVVISPNGTGIIQVTSNIVSDSDGVDDLGTSLLRFNSLYLDNSISDGTTSITQSTLQSLRDINVGVGLNYTIFWDGSKWVSSAPDSEIDHGTLSGLLDDDHTQYALLAGRAGGQDLIGGTAANDDLTLESTSNVTKGFVFVKSDLAPFTNASFSGSWAGTDLGDASFYFRDLYTRGEAKNFRVENFTEGTLPAFSSQNVGRLIYATDSKKLYVDDGTQILEISKSKFLSDTVWNGSDTTKDVTVSSTILDAREAIWALHDNSSDFDRIYCSIKAISATQVRITVSPALPAGSYRLIGLE